MANSSKRSHISRYRINNVIYSVSLFKTEILKIVANSSSISLIDSEYTGDNKGGWDHYRFGVNSHAVMVAKSNCLAQCMK